MSQGSRPTPKLTKRSVHAIFSKIGLLLIGLFLLTGGGARSLLAQRVEPVGSVPAVEKSLPTPAARLVYPLIVGGQEADPGEYPSIKALVFPGPYLCGGSLIHPQWVLTAAHCVDDMIPGEVTVYPGSSALLEGFRSVVSLNVILIVIVVAFIGQLLHATVGFGDALVAMPILSIALGMRTATPLIALLGSTVTLLILLQSWREIEFGSAWRLVTGSAAGIPVGLWLVGYAPEALSMGLLGVVVAGFALYALARPTLPELHQSGWVYPAGFLAGVLGAAYTINGPPVILYGTLRRWSSAKFRATLQGFFLPNGVMILAGHALSGLWTRQVFTLYLLALPAALIAFWLGSRINRRIPAQRFTKLIYGVLVVLGMVLIVQAVR